MPMVGAASKCRELFFVRRLHVYTLMAFLGVGLLDLSQLGYSGQKSQPKPEKQPPQSEIFGVGWTADSLANIEIGRFPGRSASYRFRAKHGGRVGKLRVFFIFRKVCPGCYANGNGERCASKSLPMMVLQITFRPV